MTGRIYHCSPEPLVLQNLNAPREGSDPGKYLGVEKGGTMSISKKTAAAVGAAATLIVGGGLLARHIRRKKAAKAAAPEA